MDYQDLLTKYMRYVCQVEGVTFAERYTGMFGDQTFTPEEWSELSRISVEIYTEHA